MLFNLFNRTAEKNNTSRAPIYLFNTLTGSREVFIPRKPPTVTMYHCGPTVYDHAHIGNLRSFFLAFLLRELILLNDYKIEQVMNITDVGHLVSDGDEGDDKIEMGAKKAHKSVKEIVDQYTDLFFHDLKSLNIDISHTTFPKASDHIGEQIAFIQSLEEKGYTYRIKDGIYFDTSLISSYGRLGNIDTQSLREGARVKKNEEKKHPTDFALWKFSPPRKKRQQEWESPWGKGFPGWHIECSAMALKYLGREIDIHTGGIDHIPVHHNNEIAQTESLTGKPLARFWVHGAFMKINGQKISKSLGNGITIKNIVDRGISPHALRLWMLNAHYQTPINFTWEALEGCQTALFKLQRFFVEELKEKDGKINSEYQKMFIGALNDNLDTPKITALTWQLIKDSEVSPEEKNGTLLYFDRILGFNLRNRKNLSESPRSLRPQDTSEEVRTLLQKREEAREMKDWKQADALREEINKKGFDVTDTPQGPTITKIPQ